MVDLGKSTASLYFCVEDTSVMISEC